MTYEEFIIDHDLVCKRIHFAGKAGKWYEDHMLDFPMKTRVEIARETDTDVYLEPEKHTVGKRSFDGIYVSERDSFRKEQLRILLKASGIYYEPSECGNGTHFEILMDEWEREYVYDFLDSLEMEESWGK